MGKKADVGLRERLKKKEICTKLRVEKKRRG